MGANTNARRRGPPGPSAGRPPSARPGIGAAPLHEIYLRCADGLYERLVTALAVALTSPPSRVEPQIEQLVCTLLERLAGKPSLLHELLLSPAAPERPDRRGRSPTQGAHAEAGPVPRPDRPAGRARAAPARTRRS